MQCFSFTEQAVPFLRGVLDEDRDPVIITPEGCIPVILGRELTQRLTRAARLAPNMTGFKLGYDGRTRGLAEVERRIGIDLEMNAQALVLKMATRRRAQEQALVRIETAAGVGGKVSLTSSVHDEEMKSGRVVGAYHAFPPMGVQPLCSAEALAQINEGVEALDLFVLMNPGARFRIQRSGELEGAKKFISVCWTGRELHPMHPRYASMGRTTTEASVAA